MRVGVCVRVTVYILVSYCINFMDVIVRFCVFVFSFLCYFCLLKFSLFIALPFIFVCDIVSYE